LRNNERVGRRRRNPVGHVRLKIDDARMRKVDVFSPPSHDRIRLDSGVPMLLEVRKECFPHIVKTVTLPRRRVADESVIGASLGICLSASLLICVLSPVILATFRTEFPDETCLFEERKTVLAGWKLVHSKPLQ
jgi:hypothetical protein